MGRLPIPAEKWSSLSKRIEALVQGQKSFIKVEPEIEALAQKFAQQIIDKHAVEIETFGFETVDIQSLKNYAVRPIGGENLGAVFFNKLRMHQCLRECGLTKRQVEIAMLLIIGRLVKPGSERSLHRWAQDLSGLDELIGADFSHLSLNSLYKVTDILFQHKDKIEAHLRNIRNVTTLR